MPSGHNYIAYRKGVNNQIFRMAMGNNDPILPEDINLTPEQPENKELQKEVKAPEEPKTAKKIEDKPKTLWERILEKGSNILGKINRANIIRKEGIGGAFKGELKAARLWKSYIPRNSPEIRKAAQAEAYEIDQGNIIKPQEEDKPKENLLSQETGEET